MWSVLSHVNGLVLLAIIGGAVSAVFAVLFRREMRKERGRL